MVKTSKRTLAFLSLIASGLLLCSAASAQDLKAWGKERNQDFGTCSFVGAAAMIMGTVGPDEIRKTGACVAERLDKAKLGYQALSPSPAAATSSLKDYYAAWIAGMRSIPNLMTMPRPAADGAATATRQRLSELWARVEIDAGL